MSSFPREILLLIGQYADPATCLALWSACKSHSASDFAITYAGKTNVIWAHRTSNPKMTESLLSMLFSREDWCGSKGEVIPQNPTGSIWWNICWYRCNRYHEWYRSKRIDRGLPNERIRLSEAFIRKHQHLVNWYAVSHNQTLSEEFIREFADRVDWYVISYRQKLGEAFLEEFVDRVDWRSVSRTQTLSETFIRKHQHKVDWEMISYSHGCGTINCISKDSVAFSRCSQNLSTEFIREFRHRIVWEQLPRLHPMSEESIREFLIAPNEIRALKSVNEFNHLSEAFIREFADRWNWYCVSSNYRASPQFLIDYHGRLSWGYDNLQSQITMELVRALPTHVPNWCYISCNMKMDEAFIREYADHVEWSNISRYQTLSEAFMREFADRIYWYAICEKQKLSTGFMWEFADRLDWPSVSQYQTLSERFIREFKDKVHWDTIFKHQKLSKSFIAEFAHRRAKK